MYYAGMFCTPSEGLPAKCKASGQETFGSHEKNTPYGAISQKKIPPMGVPWMKKYPLWGIIFDAKHLFRGVFYIL